MLQSNSITPDVWSWLNDLTSTSSEKLPRAFCRLTLQQARIRSHVCLVRQNALRACTPLTHLDRFVGLRAGRKAGHRKGPTMCEMIDFGALSTILL